jgi:hypothetical protein
MSDPFHAQIRSAINGMRHRKSSRPSPDNNPLMIVGKLISREATRRHGAVTLTELDELAKEGIVALFGGGRSVSPGEVSEMAMGMSAGLQRLPPEEASQGAELNTLLSILATHQLLDAHRLTEEQAAALYMIGNMTDDVLHNQGRPGYFLRPAILAELNRGFSRLPDAVRHVDLVVSLKWALMAVRLDPAGTYDIGLRELNELPDRIARRIAETHDGHGHGRCPNELPIDPRKVAGRFLEGPRSLRAGQIYRSLPRLKAEAHYELGRLLADTRFGASEANLDAAHAHLNQATLGYFATNSPMHGAISKIVAAECLNRLVDFSADDTIRQARLARLLDFGAAAARQIDESDLPDEQRSRLRGPVITTFSRAWVDRQCRRLLGALTPGARTPNTTKTPREIIEENSGSVAYHEMRAAQMCAEDPWCALASLSALVIESVGFTAALAPLIGTPNADAEEQGSALMAQRLGTLVDAELLGLFVDIIVDAEGDLRTPARALARPLAAGFRRHPLASPRILFEGIEALLRLLAAAGQALSGAQWTALSTILDRIGSPPTHPVALLSFQRHEASALGASLRLSGTPSLTYLDTRIRTLEKAMSDPLLSTSERAIVSSWLWQLVSWFSPYVDEFRTPRAERAMAFIERFGASVYRADTIWVGRGDVRPPLSLGYSAAPPVGSLPIDGSAASLAWTMFYHAREMLDLWSRFRVAEEVRRVNPFVNAAFAGDLARPTRTTVSFPLDLTPDEQEGIERTTGVSRDRWEYTPTVIRIHVSPSTHQEFCHLVDEARRGLIVACRDLNALGELSHDERLPDIDTDRLRALLVARPDHAIIMMDAILPVPVPLHVFYARGDQIVRHDVGHYDDTPRNGAAFNASYGLGEAIDDDRRQLTTASFIALGEALEAVREAFGPWSREIAEVLGREGVREILIVARGVAAARIPWEDLPIDDDARLGERFQIHFVHTLATLRRSTTEGAPRRGTLQIHGAGLSENMMRPAATMMRSLAISGIAETPVAGAEACDGPRLWESVRRALRLRLFTHGYHHPTRPTADCITLVDSLAQDEYADLSPELIRILPLRGLRCVELWACEGAAQGRHVMEHGAAEEPEDLTTALLLAGAERVLASRWHVPALPTALLMERFALLVASGAKEAMALASSRTELRASFSSGGPFERAMVERARGDLPTDDDGSPPLDDQAHRDRLIGAFDDTLHALRVGWYEAQGLAPPLRISSLGIGLERLIRFVPPRSERVVADAVDGQEAWTRTAVTDFLKPLQNQACWGGWQITLRSIDEWLA